MLGIDSVINSISILSSTIVDKIWPDANEVERGKLQQAILQVQNEYNLVLGQLKINEIEAGNSSIFVSGWRPALGWVCVAAFSYEYLFRVLFNGGLAIFNYPTVFTGLDLDSLGTLLVGMLGLTGARTVEKIKKVASK